MERVETWFVSQDELTIVPGNSANIAYMKMVPISGRYILKCFFNNPNLKPEVMGNEYDTQDMAREALRKMLRTMQGSNEGEE